MTHDSKELRPTVTDTQQSLTPEMVRLVLAARHVAFVDQEFESLHELDEASEAFAKFVPWDDDPNDEVDALPAASPAEAGSPAPYVDPDLDKAGNRKYWSERNACESATPPKSAPDAMREALEPFFTYLKQVRDRFPESSSDTIIIGGPYNLTYAHFEKLAAAFFAPVPPPDGAAEPDDDWEARSERSYIDNTKSPPSDDVRSALAPFAEAADGAASVRYSDEFVIWQKLTVGHLRTAKAALRSAPVSARDAVIEALNPFATIADDLDRAHEQRVRHYADEGHKAGPPNKDSEYVSVRVGSCRKARTAIRSLTGAKP